jgi:hypothetical protein
MPLPEIHLSSLAYTFGHWLPREREPDFIDLNAPYQRGSVWTIEQRQALIKSLYMGVPIGSIIVSKLPYREGSPFHYRVVDGKQRVEACRAFVDEQFGVPASWFAAEYGGRESEHTIFWSELSDQGRRRFEMSTLVPALEFSPEVVHLGRGTDGKRRQRRRTDAEILQAEAELYGLVNGGGTPQTEDDLHRAALLAKGSPLGE